MVKTKKICILIFIIIMTSCSTSLHASNFYSIGVFYFPGWITGSSEWWNPPWNLIKSYPEREPLLGWYPEGELSIAEKQIEWMYKYGIDFVVYDWYWENGKTKLDHAIDNHRHAKNRNKLKYCLLWANHSSVPSNREQFVRMVDYWVETYFKDSQYLTIQDRPTVIVFSPQLLRDNAAKFGMSTKDLFTIARERAAKSGLKGIYIIAATPANSYWVNKYLPESGYDALTAYNYHAAPFTGEFTGTQPNAISYEELTAGYQSQWSWILKNSKLPYIVPMSSGWNKRPWGSNTPHDNCTSTPESFKKMLEAGRKIMDQYPEKTLRMGIIYAWNEFGEGGYIEPTKKWGFRYLQAVKDVFGK